MNTIHTFIQDLKQKNDLDEIEVELKLIFDKQYHAGKLSTVSMNDADAKYIFRTLFNVLAERYKLQEQQSVNLISKDGINKQILYSCGVKDPNSRNIYSKTRICDQYLTHGRYTWKLKACRERALPNYDDRRTNYNLIRFKRRFSAVLSADWRIDYTFIIQLPYNSPEATIRDAKERIFLIEEYRAYETAQSIEVEIEYTKSPKDLTMVAVQTALNLFPVVSLPNADMYDFAIDALKSICSDKVIRGDRRLSIKQLLPQTATLTKKEYLNMVINEERAAEFYISHKLDGERVILFIGAQFAGSTETVCGYLTTEKWHSITRALDYMPAQICSAILDCELYSDTLYVFDILDCVWKQTIPNKNNADGKSNNDADNANDVENNTSDDAPSTLDDDAPIHSTLYMCPYLIRRKFIAMIQRELESMQFTYGAIGSTKKLTIRIKPSHKLGALYQSAISTLIEEKTDYPRDGIIFTSVRDPYLTTQYFKWKPPANMTIEFIAKQCPAELLGTPPYARKRGKTLYMLYVGIRADIARAFGLRKLPHYHSLFPQLQRRDYFPIHFAPSSAPLAYLYWADRADLEDKVVEMIWTGGEQSPLQAQNSTLNRMFAQASTSAQWQLVKVRPDRQADYLNSQYFGNDYYVAESIWNSYHNPFTSAILCKSPPELKREFYFVEDDSADFRATRKFNNWVKAKLLEIVGPQHWLLDIGAGKGQDFMKYLNMNVQNVIFADVNLNNIDEIISRKHSYYKQGLFRKTTMATHTICCDALSPAFLEQVKQFTPYCKLVVCNFAIHYICYNLDTAKTFAEKVAELLPAGGRLLITYLDGKSVYAKLAESDGEWVAGKYHIRGCGEDDGFTGQDQRIQIKLPFSRGFYDEYLFNSAILTKALRSHKINVELSGGFSEFIDQFQKEKNNYTFDDTDREYIQLLGYTIYHK